MTDVSEEIFLQKLYEVVHKLSGISKTQSYRFKREWDEHLKRLNEKPHLIRPILVEKDRFLTDIDYRIQVLDNVRLSFEDAFNSIKSLLSTLYNLYFKDPELFKGEYSEQDQVILKYLVAKKILGDLFQYNQLDHDTVPLKYNVMARSYFTIKLKGMRDTEVLDSLKKIKLELSLPDLKKIMEEIIEDGLLNRETKGRYFYYHLEKELELSDKGKIHFQQTLSSLIDWPTQLWRSFYNVREINVTVNNEAKDSEMLNKILIRAATQGYIASHYVFTSLVEYYQKIK